MGLGLDALRLSTIVGAFLGSLWSSQLIAQEQTKPIIAWAPKPAALAPYVAPNRPVWRLAEILAKHGREQDWLETVVNTRDFIGQWISLGPKEKTKTVFYADDKVFWVVQSGQMRVTIDGIAPFIASKGFVVEVPFRVPYSIETVSAEPSLRFEIRPSGEAPIYPLSEKPMPQPGVQYIQAKFTGRGAYDKINHPYLDFWKDIVQDGGSVPGSFIVRDDHTALGIIRGNAAPLPPDSNWGHFHENFDEFWFVAEGTQDFLIEGEPLIHASQGDIVFAPSGRWHRASFGGTGMSTRFPIFSRPGDLHFFQVDAKLGD